MTRSRCLVLSLVPASLIALGASGCKTPTPVLHEGLEQERYLRVVLRPDKESLYSSNYDNGDYGGYQPGNKVEIMMFSSERVDMKINNIPHKMYPRGDKFNTGDIDGFLKKYFVSDLGEIGLAGKAGGAPAPNPLADDPNASDDDLWDLEGGGGEGGEPAAADPGWRLDKMEPSIKQNVMQGIAAVGMTKHQVFMALGPPPELNFGSPALSLPLDTILQANRWVYFSNWIVPWFFKHAYIFDGEKLITVEK